MVKQDVRLNIKYAMMQACYWSMTAAAMVFVVALLRNRGLSDDTIGYVLSAKYVAAVASQLLLSNIVDRFARQFTLKRVIYVLTLLCAMTTLIFYFFPMKVAGTVICFSLFGCTINGVTPYINALSSRYVHMGRKVIYGYARAVGSLMWGIGSIVISYFVEEFGVESVLLIQFTMVVGLFICAILMDDVDYVETKDEEKDVHSYLEIFRGYPSYTLFLAASICMFIANNLLSTFMVDIVAKVGGGNAELGYVEMALALFELPPAILFLKLNKKIGIRKVLCLCIVSTFLQNILTMYASNIYLLIAAQGFQMLGVGLYWTASVFFVTQVIPKADWVKGQALVSICSLGLGGVLGSFFSGQIMNRYGLSVLMKCSAVIVFLGIVLMFAGMNTYKGYQYNKER